MEKGTVKWMLGIGLVLILLALIIGPTSTATTTECTESTMRTPPQCYDATVTESNPSFYLFMGLGSLMAGPSFWWLVIRNAVESAQK